MMPDQHKDLPLQIVPKTSPDGPDSPKQPEDTGTTEKDGKKTARARKNFRPIIMCLTLLLWFGSSRLPAQFETSLSLKSTYSDNVFQLSESDLQRFDAEAANLDFIRTTDDLNLALRIDLAYPLNYKWWKFTPSVTANLSQNVSNTDKQRRDALLRFRVDRYYWNITALYGFYPFNYVRDYVDSDGSAALENYSYERNLWRGDLNLKPLKATTIQFHGRYEEYFYNQYWTEFDGNATTLGIGARHAFPLFSVGGMYLWRAFDNSSAQTRDCSYESDIFSGDLRLVSMPLSDAHPKGAAWYPALALSYEERFFQSADQWYGGRIYKIYNTQAALNFQIDPRWNLSLDYSHTFRNIESPVESVLRSKEYSENKVAATVKYSF